MSHGKERAEKRCLNCNAELIGLYCHHCGQANTEPRETFLSLVKHFFYDITHFDGKFFFTIRYLFSRPGFLPLEFTSGRRARYLDPFRMYIFTSAVFFLIFFNLYNVKTWDIGENSPRGSAFLRDSAVASAALADARTAEDSAVIGRAFDIIRSTDSASARPAFKTVDDYKEAQRQLPAGSRDGWINRQLQIRKIELKEKYGDNQQQFFRDVFDKFLHTFPYLLFVSLPLFALFLGWIFPNRYYFAEHAIFLVYLYIFTFCVVLLMIGLGQIGNYSGWRVFNWSTNLIFLYGLWYTLKAFRRFYRLSRASTIFRFVIFNILSIVLILILFILFLGISFLQV